MPDDLSGRAHAIFTRALDADGAARDALVQRECAGEPALESRVRKLLRAADRAGGFLESPALAGAAPSRVEVPDAVGDYTVIGVLGVGGMAVVYEAVQDNPTRHVALKVMHQSMSHTDAYLRFRLETQTLARLQHPGIAQIYEAGTANLGRATPSPFFAMELVPDAVTITNYAQRHQLSLRERAAMFANVCDAVLHGHQNGVIHRDIKPGNVLVGPDGQPKVIDFGIARSTDPAAPALTTAIDARGFIGTLNYMSPEQCGDAANIDVRADVYALGVLLFELITGRLPHDLTSLSIPAAVQVITQQPTPRASTIRPEAAGDLDAIIAMATDKDRTRRYSGAGALAADIRRWIDYRPIEARRPTTHEQIVRFAQRNPPLAVAIAASLLILVGAAVLSGTLALIAVRARDAALQRERELEIVTDFQDSLLRAINVAEMGDYLRASLRESVEQAVGSSGNSGTAELGDDDLRRFEALTAGVNFTSLAVRSLHQSVLKPYQRSLNQQFAEQPLLRARLLFRLASTMNTLGLHTDAEPVISQALNIRVSHLGPDHKDSLQARHALGSLLSRLGRFDESEQHLRTAYEGAIRLNGLEAPETLRNASSLAGLYRRMGRHEDSSRIWSATLEAQRRTLGPDHADTLRTLHNIGVLHAVQGNLDEAEAAWREVLDRRRRTLGEDAPEFASTLSNLGVLLQDRGRYADAAPMLEAALALSRRVHGDAHQDTLSSIAQVAALRQETGDLESAERLLRECVDGRRATLGAENADTLSITSFLGVVLTKRGRIEEGLAMIRETLAIQRRTLNPDHPSVIDSASFLRAALRDAGRISEALIVSHELQEIIESSTSIQPWTVGEQLAAHADLLSRSGPAPGAHESMVRGYDLIVASLGPLHPRSRAAAGYLEEHFRRAHELDPTPENERAAAEWAAKAQLPERPDGQ